MFPRLIGLFFSLSLFGCAHTVRLISVPAGAKISVDGKPIGEAPLLFNESSGRPGRSFKFKAELPGFPPQEREESVRICPTAANLIMDAFVVGFFYGFCLRDEYIFDLTEKN